MVFQDVEIDLYGSEPLRQIICLFASRAKADSPVDRMWVSRFERLPAQPGSEIPHLAIADRRVHGQDSALRDLELRFLAGRRLQHLLPHIIADA